MQKWEYCLLTGVKIDVIGNLEGNYPKLTYFSVDGKKEINLSNSAKATRPKGFEKVSEGWYIAAVIADLGIKGWEMVGTGQSDYLNGGIKHIIYFRRPIA
jgi:hypothetical protein